MRTATLILILLFAAAGAAQDDVHVEAKLSSPQVTEEDIVQLIISITSASNVGDVDIKLPPLPDFERLGESTSTQFSQFNNRISSTVSHIYNLRPLKRGTLTIGSATVTIAGQSYVTEVLRVTVTEGRSGELIILRQRPDRESVYVGQQLTISTELLFKVRVLNYDIIEQPPVEGFVVEDDETLQDVQIEEIEYRGQPYYRALLRRQIFFPLAPGTKELKPVHFRVEYRDSSFTLQSKLARRRTNALRIEVKPVPEEGKPEGYQGAVGEFDLNWSLSPDRGTVNEPLNLHIALAGSGDIERAPAVSPQLPESFEIINSKSEGNAGLRGMRWTGDRNWEFIIIPNRAGKITLDALTYPFFNPETGSFETASTEPISLQIDPPTRAGRTTSAPAPVVGEGAEFDIRYIKTPAGPIADQGAPFYLSPMFWALILVPLLFNAGVVAANRLMKGRRGIDRESRRRRALTAATRKLSRMPGSKDAGNLIRAAVLGYFADKLKLEIDGLSINDARAALVRSDLHEHPLVEELTDVLHACDASRYTPDGEEAVDFSALASRADRALSELDEML